MSRDYQHVPPELPPEVEELIRSNNELRAAIRLAANEIHFPEFSRYWTCTRSAWFIRFLQEFPTAAAVRILSFEEFLSGEAELARGVALNFHPSRLVMVHVIAVLPGHQGSQCEIRHTRLGRWTASVGRGLYRTIGDWACQQDAQALVANVAITPIPNLRSLALHRKLGFRVSGEAPYVIIRQDRAGADVIVRFVQLLGVLEHRINW